MRLFRNIVLVLLASVALSGCEFNFLEYKAKTGLQVITNDQPSAVFLNGQYLNKTPLIEKNLKPGEYQLSIEPEDPKLVKYETSLTLRKGLLTVITWKPGERPELSSGVILEMETLKDKNKTEVSFTTIPDNAIINIASKKEFSPVIIPDVSPGVQEFEVTLPSYETQHHSINVQPGYRTHVTVKLGKLQATGNTEPEANADTTPTTPPDSNSATGSGDLTGALGTANASNAATLTGTLTILKTGFFQDGTEVLRVRETPDSKGAEQGFVEVGSRQQYLGEQKGGWYKISFNGNPAWVNGAYAKLE